MFDFIEFLKVILFGFVEGVTEWLPVSSTGHMILLEQLVHLNVSEEFWNLFLVVIQLGAIMAVVVLYFKKLWPFYISDGAKVDKDKMVMWLKILVASIPAGVIGILFDDYFEAWFYNYVSVAIALIVFGIWFIVIETTNKNKISKINSISDITYKSALIIGCFQLLAAIFPGTSRSGATIIGALMIGVSRTTAAEFTFFLAIPAMFGGSAIKLLKYNGIITSTEIGILILGMVVAFVVSMLAIKFLLGYIRKNDFKVFGWYRIVLGVLILAYYFLFVLR